MFYPPENDFNNALNLNQVQTEKIIVIICSTTSILDSITPSSFFSIVGNWTTAMILTTVILSLLRHFHIGTLDIVSMDSSSYSNLTAVLSRNLVTKYHFNDVAECGLNCLIIADKEDDLSRIKQLSQSARIFVCCFDVGESPEHFAPININLFFVEVAGSDDAKIIEKYTINGERISRVIATYQSNRWRTSAESIIVRRSNMHGSHLKILVENDPPYMILDNYARNQGIYLDLAEKVPHSALRGAFGTVLFAMAKDLNFTFDLYRPWGEGKIGRWGSKGPDSEWTGMMGMMQRRLFDLAAVPFSIKTSRAEVVDYVFPAGNYKLGLVIRDPNQEDLTWFTFGSSFRFEAWFVIFVTAVVVTLFMRVYSKPGRRHPTLSKSVVSWCENFSFAFAANFGGRFAADKVGHSDKERVFILTVLFFGSIVFMAYKASLTSHLSVVKYKLPFHSLESLYEDTEYTITTTGNSSKVQLKDIQCI